VVKVPVLPRLTDAISPGEVVVPHPNHKDQNRFLARMKRELMKYDLPLDDIMGYYTVPIRYAGLPYDLPFVYFVNRGCSYDHAGACIECNFGRGERVPDDRLIARVGELIKQFRGWPAIYLTPSGSMFDDAEVPEHVRLEIFHLLRTTGFEFVATESRPEFLTEENIQRVREILGDEVELEIGLGLESINDWVRKNCINKMLSLDTLARAVALCHRCGAKVYAHVLTKPPFLNEFEAVEDAIETATWAFEHGVDRLGFALTNIKPGTVTQWLAARGIYRPPTYWSILQILLSLRSEWLSHIGLFGFDSSVKIEYPASNCPRCTPHIRSLLQTFCYTKDIQFLHQAEAYPCRCKTAWLDDIRRPDLPLVQRVARHYEELGRGILGDEWWETNKDLILSELVEI
jgi:radical SAM enzyme (TIGR01210 family)